MYAAGKGTPKDEAAAVNWYKYSAEKGNVAAQNALGLMYAEGRGVIKDAVEAHAWLNLAGASGNEKARERLILLEAKMTPEQISEATKLAKQRFDLLRSSISKK
jgi:TPR repeat protein